MKFLRLVALSSILFSPAAYSQVPLIPKQPLEIVCSYKGLQRKLYFQLDFQNRDFINLVSGQSLGKLDIQDTFYSVLNLKFRDDSLATLKLRGLVGEDVPTGGFVFTLDRRNLSSDFSYLRPITGNNTDSVKLKGYCAKYASKRSI